MKVFFMLVIGTLAMTAWSKDVKDFNKELIQNVQKDIEKENIDEFKEKKVMKREPASVETEVEPVPKQEKLNQFGPNKW